MRVQAVRDVFFYSTQRNAAVYVGPVRELWFMCCSAWFWL